MTRHPSHRQPEAHDRRGVAAAEFAVMLPLFLALVLGILEFGAAFDASVKLTAAVREGGRLASMDFSEVVPEGQTANQKVIQDIRSLLHANGIDRNAVTVTITYAEGDSAGQTFDLEDPDNYLELFRISVQVPYSAVSDFPEVYFQGRTLDADAVFRMGRVSMSG